MESILTTEQRMKALKYIIENNMPVNKILGMEIRKLEEGFAEVCIPFKKEFIGDFSRGLWHGGILASIADSTSGLVALTLARKGDNVNTIDMRIDYLHGAIDKDIMAVSHLVKAGKRVIVADVKLFQKHQDDPVAVARCAFSIKRHNQ
ncbi:MAG: phenylacetic acid degradation protein [Bacteroidetes bacterium]|nr:MAG: phenylacetic acid degradation protein [Bacteroidota bacterium]